MGINTFLFITAVVAANITIFLLNRNCQLLTRHIEVLETRMKMLESDVFFLTDKVADHEIQKLKEKEESQREKE